MLVLQTKECNRWKACKHICVEFSPSILDCPSVPTDALGDDPVEEDSNQSFLAPVGEVVVTSGHVVVVTPLGDLLWAQIKVGSSIVQFRHFTSKLTYNCRPRSHPSPAVLQNVGFCAHTTYLESIGQGSGVTVRPDQGRSHCCCRWDEPGNCSPSDQTWALLAHQPLCKQQQQHHATENQLMVRNCWVHFKNPDLDHPQDSFGPSEEQCSSDQFLPYPDHHCCWG